jgi:ATP-dependent RNA helicase SUPV3L1/SUV3
MFKFLIQKRNFSTEKFIPWKKSSTYSRSNSKPPFKQYSPQVWKYPKFKPDLKLLSKSQIEEKLKFLTNSTLLKTTVKAFGLPSDLFDSTFNPFIQSIDHEKFKKLSKTNEFIKTILPLYFQHLQDLYPKEHFEFKDLLKLSDLRSPSEWHPFARSLNRKIILHLGPTNSGKTFNALKRLEETKNGIYCGPLRLLAHEVYDKFKAKGMNCNLITGQIEKHEDSDLYSCTVEMVNYQKEFEVAVIDEIQMMQDPDRGWAWTWALLGCAAKEVHLCGENRIKDLVIKSDGVKENVFLNKG